MQGARLRGTAAAAATCARMPLSSCWRLVGCTRHLNQGAIQMAHHRDGGQGHHVAGSSQRFNTCVLRVQARPAEKPFKLSRYNTLLTSSSAATLHNASLKTARPERHQLHTWLHHQQQLCNHEALRTLAAMTRCITRCNTRAWQKPMSALSPPSQHSFCLWYSERWAALCQQQALAILGNSRVIAARPRCRPACSGTCSTAAASTLTTP